MGQVCARACSTPRRSDKQATQKEFCGGDLPTPSTAAGACRKTCVRRPYPVRSRPQPLLVGRTKASLPHPTAPVKHAAGARDRLEVHTSANEIGPLRGRRVCALPVASRALTAQLAACAGGGFGGSRPPSHTRSLASPPLPRLHRPGDTAFTATDAATAGRPLRKH